MPERGRAHGTAGIATVARFLRTLRHAHPVQIIARPVRLLAKLIPGVPTTAAPELRDRWHAATPAVRALALGERKRARERLARLLVMSKLRAYEETYGLECADDDVLPRNAWRTTVAIEPYPASVRARRLAVATRLGARGAREELARAARAVLLQPEVHLLGNHLLENGFALVCAGAVARGLEADVWWQAGVALLAWQLDAQFLGDGGHVERSASYHLALLAGLLESIELATASGRAVPPAWLAVAARALGWAAAVRAPDGTYPLFNDAALDAAPPLDDVVTLGRALGLGPAENTPASRVPVITRLEPTGWVRVDGTDGACLFVDAGPDADGWQPGHAHADGLTFELWVAGERAVVDFGVASYEIDEARRQTRATSSHNTVEVDGRDSCEVWAAFRVGRRGRGRVLDAATGLDGAVLRLDHDGYGWLPEGPRHTRTMRMTLGTLEITDRVHGGRHALASRVRVTEGGARVVRVEAARGPVESVAGVWHARHGDANRARVFEQYAAAGLEEPERELVWRITW